MLLAGLALNTDYFVVGCYIGSGLPGGCYAQKGQLH
jgi:hypothetical protein